MYVHGPYNYMGCTQHFCFRSYCFHRHYFDMVAGEFPIFFLPCFYCDYGLIKHFDDKETDQSSKGYPITHSNANQNFCGKSQ